MYGGIAQTGTTLHRPVLYVRMHHAQATKNSQLNKGTEERRPGEASCLVPGWWWLSHAVGYFRALFHASLVGNVTQQAAVPCCPEGNVPVTAAPRATRKSRLLGQELAWTALQAASRELWTAGHRQQVGKTHSKSLIFKNREHPKTL